MMPNRDGDEIGRATSLVAHAPSSCFPKQAIKRALRQVFPGLLDYGRHKGRDAYIDALTLLTDRVVDLQEFNEKRALIESGPLTMTENVQ